MGRGYPEIFDCHRDFQSRTPGNDAIFLK